MDSCVDDGTSLSLVTSDVATGVVVNEEEIISSVVVIGGPVVLGTNAVVNFSDVTSSLLSVVGVAELVKETEPVVFPAAVVSDAVVLGTYTVLSVSVVNRSVDDDSFLSLVTSDVATGVAVNEEEVISSVVVIGGSVVLGANAVVNFSDVTSSLLSVVGVAELVEATKSVIFPAAVVSDAVVLGTYTVLSVSVVDRCVGDDSLLSRVISDVDRDVDVNEEEVISSVVVIGGPVVLGAYAADVIVVNIVVSVSAVAISDVNDSDVITFGAVLVVNGEL